MEASQQNLHTVGGQNDPFFGALKSDGVSHRLYGQTDNRLRVDLRFTIDDSRLWQRRHDGALPGQEYRMFEVGG
jgi:hypothetical protein